VLPDDDRPRTALAGISTAHVGSPAGSVIESVVPRLHGGNVFVTRVAPGGSGDGVVSADGGSIRVRTEGGGARYLVQAVDDHGDVVRTLRVTSGTGCTP
jgi:hypothetical protein